MDRVGAVRVPLLLAAGDRDAAYAETAHAFAAAAPKASPRVVVVPSAAHGVGLLSGTTPAVNDAVTTFLRQTLP